MLEEQQFQRYADQTLSALARSLADAADEHDFDTDFNAGALTVEFDDPPAKFVISPNAPVRQIWVSAHSKSYKLDWKEERQTFVLPDTGQTLKELIQQAIREQLGEDVTLS
jgi:iron donor protein CyaY